MTILALEFSSSRRSVALAHETGPVLAEAVESTGGRGTNALGLIDQALAAARLQRQAIDVLAVGLGPGSYTGIRAALAVAQGWQLARNVKTLGISSTESLAAQAQAEGLHGHVHLVMDAQRGEYYLARWEISDTERRSLSPLAIVPAAELAARESVGEICAGPDRKRALFPSAAMLAVLAQTRCDFVSAETLTPIYLRETMFVKAPASRNA
jgi:tRNA threonylcarbamoyladenosine biosynthesis protein TsaB